MYDIYFCNGSYHVFNIKTGGTFKRTKSLRTARETCNTLNKHYAMNQAVA